MNKTIKQRKFNSIFIKQRILVQARALILGGIKKILSQSKDIDAHVSEILFYHLA